MKKPFLSIMDIVVIGLFIAIFFVSSNLSFPVPGSPVPFTLQIFAVLLSGSILGFKRGLVFIAAIIIFTAAGIPLMSKFSGGVAVLYGPTSGFIWGFIAIIAVMGLYRNYIGKYFKKFYILGYILFGIIAVALDYLCGAAGLVYNGKKASYMLSAVYVFTTFLLFDIIKVVIASIIDERLKKYLKF